MPEDSRQIGFAQARELLVQHNENAIFLKLEGNASG